jgi:hypothetical protein
MSAQRAAAPAGFFWHKPSKGLELPRRWYQPLLDCLYDYPAARAGDLDQLEQIAFGYTSRGLFLTELTLDPPGCERRGGAKVILGR